ncbi:hypothetical protein RE438_28080 (plasmid) [Bacillus wiedmannii]|uniref:hypothetical protein n=1 Tax=Bacillus wiedmannii TaxID=1890302 RepID=UPI002882D89F|nr:hypothetical protein [Bacillus wiedmannii]WMS85109.1 hypothetical protein RE438_28080 [Bacillus wiedmannii]
MNSIKFDIDKYVEIRLTTINEESLSLEDYDDLPEKKEVLRKNVKNLLERCINNKYYDGFSFELDVLEYFPLNRFDEADIGKFLDHIFVLKGIGKSVGNKVISNLSKIYVDNKDKQVEGKWRLFDFFYMKSATKSDFANMVELYKAKNRNIVRKDPMMVKTLIDEIEFNLNGLKKENNLTNLSFAVDYVSDVMLQIFNYWVITIEGLNFKKKMQLVDKLELYLKDFEKKILEIKSDRVFMTSLEDAVSIFVSFLSRRNDFGEYMSILHTLEEEQEKEPEYFAAPLKHYKVKKGEIVPHDKLKKIITEGIHVDGYDDKLKRTKEIIILFSQYGGKTASVNFTLDLKVYFREIYLSDSKYKRQASTIVRKYLQEYRKNSNVDSFEKASEYMFLREKINRGYFRETSDLRLYSKKNKLQEGFYKVLLSIMLSYDYPVSIDLLIQLVKELIPICFRGIDELLEENNVPRIF